MKLVMSDDLPNQDLAKVKALAEAVREMTAGMRVVEVVQALASVITASVETGSISEMDLTKVVLPTPNPPATTIFVDVAVGGRLAGDRL